MNGTKLYVKYPLQIFVAYILTFAFLLVNFMGIIGNDELSDHNIRSMVFIFIYFLFFAFFVFIVIQTNFRKKIYFEISDSGIRYNQYFKFFEKNIKWDEELYYLVTPSVFSLYSKKNMLPLNGKIENKNNLINGYVSIKTKKALDLKWYSKGWIYISTSLLGSDISVNDVIKTINKYCPSVGQTTSNIFNI